MIDLSEEMLSMSKEMLSIPLHLWFISFRCHGLSLSFLCTWVSVSCLALFDTSTQRSCSQVSLHNHFPLNCFGRCTTYSIGTDLAQLQHYRKDCVGPLRKTCKDFRVNTVRDTTIWKYKELLIARTYETLSRLNFFTPLSHPWVATRCEGKVIMIVMLPWRTFRRRVRKRVNSHHSNGLVSLGIKMTSSDTTSIQVLSEDVIFLTFFVDSCWLLISFLSFCYTCFSYHWLLHVIPIIRSEGETPITSLVVSSVSCQSKCGSVRSAFIEKNKAIEGKMISEIEIDR